MSYLLGIDVGTTRTAAAIGRQGARPGETEVVNLGDRASAVPSVLYVDADGTLVVGEAAERRAVTDPDHVAREFKRRIGDPTPIVVGGRPWAPEELSARLVRWVVDRVSQREGGHPARIAVTHPASWGAHKKDRFGGALGAQGTPVTFLAEPQAAALHYAAAERVEPGSTIAVYDFGGGTFDAAVVHKEAHGFTLLGRPEGVERLGGIDFDEVVFEHVVQGLPEAFEGLDESDPAVLSAVAAVRRECSEAKEALSSDTEVAIPVFTPAGQGSVRLHRSEFEAAIRPQVEETVDALRSAIASAGLAPEQLTAVLLVGGSSRIPLVGQLVSEQLGRPVAVDADPKNAIAMGAALSLMPSGAGAGGPDAAMVPPPRAGGSARFPVAAAAPPFGAAPFGAAGAQMSSGTPSAPGQAGGAYGPAATGTQRPGGYETSASGAAPATQRMSGSTGPRAGAMPPPPPPRPGYGEPEYGGDPYDYEYMPEPQRGGRSPAWLVSVGGAAAALAVIGAAFLLPSNTPVRAADTATTPNSPSAPPEVVQEPSVTDEPPVSEETTRENRPAPVQPARPSAPPATTAPPVTTTQPPAATTTPPQTTTSQPPPQTTTQPAPSSTSVQQPDPGGSVPGAGASGGEPRPDRAF